MRMRIFKADKGDCMLLTGADGKHVLIDGGMRTSYREFCSKSLSNLDEIDVVYVSHIDRDHVFGILQMMDDHVDWKVHDFQVKNGNPNHPVPDSHRPPTVGRIWQNAFHDQVGENAGAIEDMLASQAQILSGHANEALHPFAEAAADLASSVGDAINLSFRIGGDQLDIPVNPEFGNRLMYHSTPSTPLSVGGMKFTVIGPFLQDLTELRAEWNEWLEDKAAFLKKIQDSAREDADLLAANEVDSLLRPMGAQAAALADLDPRIGAAADDLALAKVLGRRSSVTVPNLASLMFHVEENGKTMLLTGDGHCDDVLEGLELAGLLRSDGTLHVNVLKIPHHGSEHNTHEEFCRRVTADHYVFCGNGGHENPDIDIAHAYIDSRLGTDAQRSGNPETGNRFRMWFNYHPDNPQSGTGGAKNVAHLHELNTEVEARDRKSKQLTATFFKGAYYSFTV